MPPNGYAQLLEPSMGLTFSCRKRAGFTLVELLLVIAMIAVFAAMAVAVVAGAQGEALKSATISRIRQVESLLNQRMEEYQVRKLGLDITQFTLNPILIRHIRDMAIADFIRVELPSRLEDVEKYPSDDFRDGLEAFTTINWSNADNDFTESSRLGIIDQLENEVQFSLAPFSTFRNPNFNMGAEYLYQILAATDFGGGPSIELLGDRAFADTDGDGLLEVVDAWGDPLSFSVQQVEAQNASGPDANVIFDDLYWGNAAQNALQDFTVTRITDETRWPSFVTLNPSVPRPLEKIRPVVGSFNIE